MSVLLRHLKEIEAAREELRKPSFVTQLFAGEPDLGLLIPFPTQDPVDKKIGDEYCARIAAFLRDHVEPQEIERTGKIPPEVIGGLKELGAFGMTIPREYGGLGLSQTNYDRVLTLVASYCNIVALLLSVHQSIGAPRPLLQFGSEEQKRKWLPRLAKGAISAFALTEPQIGSDPANMQTTAVLSPDGTHYIINGEKLWCTNSLIAEIIVLTAKVDGKVTAFIVEMDTPGIEILHRCSFMGCRGIENGWLRFRNVRVPAENVIGEVGKGLRIALSALNVGRISVAAICLGMAKQVYPYAVEWACQRKTFGKPIGEHELNTHKIAWMAADIFAMDALIHLVAGLVDHGILDFRVEAAITKLICSERLWNIVDTAMQLRGGRGYETADSLAARGEPAIPVEQIFRDARLDLIGEGASEILKLFIAREVWDPHIKRAAPILAPGDGSAAHDLVQRGIHLARLAQEAGKLGVYYARWYAKQLVPDGDLGPAVEEAIRDPDLRDQLRYVKRTSKRLARLILRLMARYTSGLEARQGIVARLADIGIDLFTMTAVCSYTQTSPGSHRLALQVCADARGRIEERFRALAAHRDEETTALGRAVLRGAFPWLLEGTLAAEPAPPSHPSLTPCAE